MTETRPGTATKFFPAGCDEGRVPVPDTAIRCSTLTDFARLVRRYFPGGDRAGRSVEIYVDGLQYDEAGLERYRCTDGGHGMYIYGRQDGATQFRYTGRGMKEAYSAIFRLANGASKVSLFNLDLEGLHSNSNRGATWGAILGGAYAQDPNRGDVSDIVMRGCRVRNVKEIGIKVDGDGNTNGVWVVYCTVDGAQVEGIYAGDGATGRRYNRVFIWACEVMNTSRGEAIEAKRNADTVEIGYCHAHRIHMDSGGAIKTERPYDVFNNIVHHVTASGSTRNGDGIEVMGGNVHCNIIWGVTGSCVVVLKSNVPGRVARVRHNTLDARRGRGAVSGNEENYLGNHATGVHSDNNIYVGHHFNGSAGGGTLNDIKVDAGDFVGPSNTETSDAGQGPGSGYLLKSGPARNSVTRLVSHDARGWARGSKTDAGALDSAATPPTSEVPPVNPPANTGSHKLTVNLHGDTGAEHVRFYLDETLAGEHNGQGASIEFVAGFDQLDRAHLEFVNDSTEGGDRNVKLISVTVDGKTIESSQARFWSDGTWPHAREKKWSQDLPDSKRGWLHVNGTLDITATVEDLLGIETPPPPLPTPPTVPPVEPEPEPPVPVPPTPAVELFDQFAKEIGLPTALERLAELARTDYSIM